MKMYKGSRLAYLRQTNRPWREAIELASKLKPGDLTHDCDSFNHIIKSIEVEVAPIRGTKKGWFISGFDVRFEDGGCQCTCWPHHPPLPVDRINEYWTTYPDGTAEEWGWKPFKEAALKGELVDERGILLPGPKAAVEAETERRRKK